MTVCETRQGAGATVHCWHFARDSVSAEFTHEKRVLSGVTDEAVSFLLRSQSRRGWSWRYVFRRSSSGSVFENILQLTLCWRVFLGFWERFLRRKTCVGGPSLCSRELELSRSCGELFPTHGAIHSFLQDMFRCGEMRGMFSGWEVGRKTRVFGTGKFVPCSRS